MRVYKGVAPKTHYAQPQNDPYRHGFQSAAQNASSNAVVRHITAYSHPSPYVSFTGAFEVAASYATKGGTVYELDFANVPAHQLVDPLTEIVKLLAGLPAVAHPWHHNGGPDLIHAISDPIGFAAALSRPVLGPNGPTPFPPNIPAALNAAIWALRDAELLALRVPASCIVTSHAVP
jgi:hypothetical protein